MARVGKPAPDFTATAVMDGKLKEISLSVYTGANHWVALIFFPKAWSFVCPTEIRAFSEHTELCLRAWNHINEMEGGLGGVHVPLMSDSNHKISRDYGVLLEEEGVAERALFIIDPKGNVRNITISDADVGRSVDETLRIIDALAFKDEYGEGCPVNWKKGDAGLKMAEQTKVDGPLEMKKSWSEWARPKLQRAWSGQSQRSIGSGTIRTMSSFRPVSETVTPPSPLVSPTSSTISIMERNMEAAMANHHIDLAT
ncbi:thioredoxin-like protein [Aureobasidium subglaciale]|nr:thioredoxin-like protein [Aureobasidium subglaciale]